MHTHMPAWMHTHTYMHTHSHTHTHTHTHTRTHTHTFFFFFWWGLLHGPQQGPDRMKEKKPIRLGKGKLLPKQKNPP